MSVINCFNVSLYAVYSGVPGFTRYELVRLMMTIATADGNSAKQPRGPAVCREVVRLRVSEKFVPEVAVTACKAVEKGVVAYDALRDCHEHRSRSNRYDGNQAGVTCTLGSDNSSDEKQGKGDEGRRDI